MPTPIKEDIRQKAIEFFMDEHGYTANTPEDNELKEGGYWIKARNFLMQNEFSRYDKQIQSLDQELDNIETQEKLSEQQNIIDILSREIESLEAELKQTKAPRQHVIIETELSKTPEQTTATPIIALDSDDPQPPTPLVPLGKPKIEYNKHELVQKNEDTKAELYDKIYEIPINQTKKQKENEENENKSKTKKEQTPKSNSNRSLKIMSQSDESGTAAKRAVKPRIGIRRTTVKQTMQQNTNASLIEILRTVADMINNLQTSGKLNPAQGLVGAWILADLLHGGAPAVGLDQQPSLMEDPTKSSYYYKINIPQLQGVIDFFQMLFAGTSSGIYVQAIFKDADVPRVLPKLISDYSYAGITLSLTHIMTTEIVTKTGTGLKSLVEAPLAVAEQAGRTTKDLSEAYKNLSPDVEALVKAIMATQGIG